MYTTHLRFWATKTSVSQSKRKLKDVIVKHYTASDNKIWKSFF